MTEAEWLATTQPPAMLELMFIQGKESERKLRLFAIVCCSRSLANFYHPDLEAAVEWAARFADGLVRLEDSETVMGGVSWALSEPCDSLNRLGEAVACLLGIPFTSSDAKRVVLEIAEAHHFASDENLEREGLKTQCHILRDIFGNPFHPITLNPSWLTSTVLSLAQGIYEDRAFDRMPILADALQDGGCDNEDILSHCRGPAEHVRGCWLVDFVLGKT